MRPVNLGQSLAVLQNLCANFPTATVVWRSVERCMPRPNLKLISTSQMSSDMEATNAEHLQKNKKRTKKEKKTNKIRPIKIEKFRNDKRFHETSYYFRDGLRCVKPYSFTFQCHIKGRWYGKKVLEVCKKEFRSEAEDFYEKAIATGLLTVNGKQVTHDRTLHSNELLRSRVHRHEPPVSGEPIKIIHSDDEVVVVDKPASIPVHPCGKYRHNTLVFILGKDYGYTGLHTVHRLDRLTSGLLIFARTTEVSKKLDAYVRNRDLEKTYLCKVKGEFPSDPVVCEEPIMVVSHKFGVCRVNPQGKSCRTEFQRLSYDGETSIVRCVPHTGRMHQIRVHLQYMGYPITNDPLYNNTVWGPELGKGDSSNHISDETLIEKFIAQHDEDLLEKLVENQSTHQKLLEDNTGVDNQLKRTEDSGEDEEFMPDVKKFKHDENVLQVDGKNKEINMVNESGMKNCNVTPENSGTEKLTSLVRNSIQIKEFDSTEDVLRDSNFEVDTEQNSLIGDRLAPTKDTESCKKKDIECKTLSYESSSEMDAQQNSNLLDGTKHDVTDVKNTKLTNNVSAGITAASQSSPTVTVDEPACQAGESINLNDLIPPDIMKLRDGETEEERLNRLVMSFCKDCKLKYRDPIENEMKIYLHALRYKGPDFDYSTDTPTWAQEHIDRCEKSN